MFTSLFHQVYANTTQEDREREGVELPPACAHFGDAVARGLNALLPTLRADAKLLEKKEGFVEPLLSKWTGVDSDKQQLRFVEAIVIYYDP